MQTEPRAARLPATEPHPLVELLDCPPATGTLLQRAAQYIDVEGNEVLFRQSEVCKGLYLVVSGQFVRKTQRISARLTVGIARPGDLVELAAVLGDGLHTYTLRAITAGSLLLLPTDALHDAFDSFPPLRMRLLEELAREVSRGYLVTCQSRLTKASRRNYGG